MTDNNIPLFAEELAKASQQAEQATQNASATPLPSDIENTDESAPYNFTQAPSVASVEASDGENSDIVVPMRPNGEEPGDATSPMVETTQPNADVDTKPKPNTPKAKPVKYPIAYTDDELKKAYSLLTDDERQGIDLSTDAGKASMSAMVDRIKLPNRLVVGADGKQQRIYLPYDPDDTSSESYAKSQKPIEVIGTEGKRGGTKIGIPIAEIMDNPSSVRWQFGDTTITGMQPITGGETQAKVKDLESASYTQDGKPLLTFKTPDGKTQKVILNATKADVDKARSERNAVAEVDLRSKEALLQARQSDIDAQMSNAMKEEGYTTPDVMQGVDDGNSLSSLVRLYLLPRINPKTAPLANAYDTNKATLDKIQAIKTNIANGSTSSGTIDDIVKSGSEVLGGFLSKVSKASTWDNGVSELSLATYGKKAYDKYMAGGKLTDDEQAMLDAIGYSLYFDEAYKDNLHNANLGAGVAESLPYAINIAIAGWTGAGKTAGKLAETSITKALKSRLLKRYGERAIARWLPSIASKATSAITEAGVATAVGGLKQEADALQRMTADVDTSTIDTSGHATYNKDSKVDGGGIAHYKAFGAGLIENLSEMAEPYIAMIPRGVKSVVSNKMAKLAKKSGTFNTLYDAMASLKPSQLSQVLDAGLRKGKINGLFEEVAGEVAGNIANAALIGDMSFTLYKESPDWQNSVFNPEVNADIVAQCAIMSYGFRVPGVIADATYNAHKAASAVRTNIMGKKAFGEKWQDVKATIDAMSPEDAVAFASDAVKEQSDGCEAVYRYAIQSKGEQLANNINANKDDNSNDITDVAHETAVKAVDAPVTEARQAVKVAQESSQDMPNSLKVSIDALVDNDASDGEFKSLFDQLSEDERPMAEQYYLSQVQLKGHEVGATARADAETEQFADAVSDMSTEVDGNAVVMTADVDGEQKVIKSRGDTMSILSDGTAVTSDKVTDVKTSPVADIIESHRSQALQYEMDKLDFAKSHNPNTINPNSGDVVMGADGKKYVYNEATTTNSDGSQVTQTCLYPAIPSEDGGIVADTAQPLLQGITKDEVLAMQDRYYDNLDNNATQGTTRNEEASDATDDTQYTTESVEDNTTDAETTTNDTTPNDGNQTEESVESPDEEQSIDQGNNQTEVSTEQDENGVNTQPKDVNVTDASKIADTYVSKISKARASKSDSVRRNADKLVSAFAKKAKASSTTDLGEMVSRLASQIDNDTAVELLDIANKELQSRKSARRGKSNAEPQSDNAVQATEATQANDATESPITEEANSHLKESEQKAKERMKYLTPSQVARLMRIGKVAKSMGLGIRFVDSMEDNGLYDPNTNTITIALDAENPIEVVFGHETMHKIAENKDDYNTIRNLAIEILGEEEFNRRVDDAEKLYNRNGYNHEKSYYEEEVVCDFMGEMLNNNNLLDRICFNVNHRILSVIRDVLEKIASYFAKSDENIVRVRTIVSAAYNNEMRRAEDYKDEETIEGARKASLRRKEEVDAKSRAYFAKNDTQVSQDEFDASQKMMDRMADMMAPYIDASVKGRRVMPEEAYGSKDAKSTIFNNSSYGKTMENTLICLRTLAYNEFVDAVKTELGRPITQRESFLASQMVYDIATDPQCLYCYVSLDRKAYDEFLLRYMNQRDKVLEGFRSLSQKEKNIGKKNPHIALPNLYKEYLDGRKDTNEQKARFDMWVNNEIAGIKTITASELATSKTRKTIVEGLDKALSKQMRDAEKYAQSASWAKKEVDYISYLGELLALNKKWIDRLTSEYGLRFYSFSEYTPAFLLENMQMVRDASLRGLRGLGYTKEIDFVKVFAPTGMNINCSCYGRLDKDGNMQMDTLQGADWEEVKNLRNKYRNVGAVFVATNDESVEWAIGQDWIDVVIPFHIVRTGADIAEFYGWNNYSAEQADKAKQGQKKMYISPVEHKNNKETFLEACERHGVTPRFSKWIDNPNYMKLVNETRLSVDESVNLKPVFDMDSAEDSWRRFVNKGGYYNGWWKVDEKGLQESIQRVVNDIKEGNNPRDVEYGNQRIPINAEKMIQEARKKRTHGHSPIMDVFDKFGNVIPSTEINANTNVEQRKSVRKDVVKEMDDIIANAKADGTYMKAPNGKKSNLNERQWAQVRTKAFKKWFGDWENYPANSSKVVDENGEPLVVTHVTDSQFTVFDKGRLGENTDFNASDENWAKTSHIGFWFNDEITSEKTSQNHEMKLFLNIRNPYRTKSINSLAEDLDGITPEDFIEYMIDRGYDGVVVPDEEFGGTSFVALSNNQIKSATENEGTFDINNKDIRKSVRKDIVKEMYDVIAKAKADGTYLKAPNGKKSNLNERQWAQVRTKAFKKWFGDWENDPANSSKVVDENGEPRVVYHGTPGGRFSVFGEQEGNSDAYTRNGMYFFTASPVVADGYSTKSHYKDDGTNDKDGHRDMTIDDSEIEIRERRDRYSKNPDKVIGYEAYYNGEYIPDSDAKSREDAMKKAMKSVARNYYPADSRVFEAFMNLRNPYIVDAENGNWRNVQYPSKEELTNRGHDGIVIENVDDSAIAVRREISTDYIALEPTQIKSATENEGTFDINNKDIRKSVRKDIASETIEEETDSDTSVGELMTRYSVRKKPAPQKTKKAYKLFKVDVNGNPHALFIDKASNLEQGIWYDADCPNIDSIKNLDAGYTYLMDMDGVVYDKRSSDRKLNKGEVKEASEKGLRWMSVTEGAKGTKLVRNVGINGSGTVSMYALRPGWHATSAPSARHIGSTDGGKEVRYRRPDERWFEIEISADNDYNDEARERYMASHPKAKRDDVYANMKGDITDKIPEDGFYNFKTNSNANPNQSWYISGSIRIVRPIGEKEAQRICDKEGVAYDLPYKDGIKNFTDNEQGLMKSAEEAASAYKEEAERPKPLVSAILHSIRGGKRNVPIDPFVEGWDSIISSDAFKLEETSFDSLKAVEEFQRYMTGSKDVPDYLNAHRALMVLSSVNKAQMDMFAGTYVENLRKAIEEMVGTAEMNKGFYAEDGALAELDRFLKAQHGLERNRDMRVRAKLSEIYNEKIAEAQVAYNQTQDKEAYDDAVKKAQEEYNVALEDFYAKRDEIVAEGLEAGDNWYLINTQLDNYVIETFFKSDKKDNRDLTLAEINALKAKRDELLERANNEQWSARRLQEELNRMLSEENFKFITGNKKMVSLPATKEYYDELAGLTGMFNWGNTPLGVYLANEEAKQFVSWYKGTENKESLDAVEKAIADINDFSLKKQKESGLVDEDYVNDQKRRYLNFVPLRDFMDVSSDDMYDYLTGNAGVGGNPVKTAKGRHSEAGPAVAGLINVANRSITAGNRNLALQKMYNIVKAKGINTLANARNRWIVRDSEDTDKWHDAEPEIAPDATAEQVTTQLEEFERNMKSIEEQGLARRVDGKRSPSEYRIMSRTQMDEHKIKVAIGGRQYIIDFLGNPRAAQAANGMTNPDVSDDAGRTLFRTFKNFLASAFTSKNIAFSVANFFRDTEHSNNYVFIKEGGEYYRRFTERQLNKFKYRSYMKEIFSKLKMFKEGKLSEDDTFYQFMNNGGATGYTFVQSQEEEAEKFVKELVEAKNGNWGKKMWNRFFDTVEYMGNVSELTNRYIAFLTSREMGRSIGRSIEDAKEVTLNFNRKGSGTKTKIDGLLPKYIPSVVEYGQRYILFFNANVQAKRQLLYMLKENPAKTTGARIGRAAFYRMMIPAIFAGVFLPAINDIVLPAIYSALGFDDDDDEEKYDYFNKLGDYERTHSINFALPNNAFISIPVSPDIAPFMSIGDVISAQMQNKRDMTFKDFIEAGTDIISPININYGSEDDINWTASAMSFFPSQMRPIGDIFVNTNFMGQPVYKGGGIGNRQYTPEFKKGMRRTSPALTAWSKFVNDMSGGDDVEKGAMDGLFNNPAVMEHLLKGYLGGYGTATLDMVINPLYNSLTGDFEDLSLKAEQLPLVGRFYKGGSRDEQMRRMERTFRNEVYERNAETRAQESELKKEAMKANREGQLYRLAELRNKYIQLVQSDKYKKYYATKQASEAISDQLKLTSTMTDSEKRYLIDMMRRTIGIYRGEIKIYGTPSEDNQ